MARLTPIRVAAVFLGLAAVGHGQTSALPPNAPTSLASGTAGPVSAPASRKANVEYSGGLLTVAANNSSLNQILREIGRLTGMKITGGVKEDRVFGTYGPARASEVITSILDGTTSNVMIVENSAEGPAELILTPRLGGATPPNPNAAGMNSDEDLTPQRTQPPPQMMPPQGGTVMVHPPGPGGTPDGLPASNGGQTGTPINGGADLGTTPGAFTPYGQTPPDSRAQPDSVVVPVNTDNPVQTTTTTDTTTTTTDTTTQPASPNGVVTPQQIYEQLQKLRQQQQTTTPQ